MLEIAVPFPFGCTAAGAMHPAHATAQIPGRFEVHVGMHGSLEMLLGWWVGGLTVLRFFWPKYPRGGSYTRDHAADARRTYDAELKTRGIIDER